jgi:hypothetical protein
MKKLNLFLILALVLGFLAFGPQGSASAVGTVDNPSGQDSGSCYGGKLQIGNAMAYINSDLVTGCTAFLSKATSYPKAPGDLKFIGTSVLVTFNQDTIPQVTVCFPTGKAPGVVYKVVGEPAYWIPVGSFEDGLGMTCAVSWGGGTYGYFGY